MSYTPPFTVSANAISLIAEISAQVERFTIRLEQEDGLRLRKINRLKSIHSSLAIEGNTLAEDQVADIINGKNVVAPLREIQEVKNAIKAYELYSKLNPYSVEDLLKAHGVLMAALTDDAGHFRHGGVGVFSKQGCVHMAPPAERVPTLIADLFEWLKNAPDHLLIKSCVFYYEFEFIHPFSDGNGRTGRLWQSLILGKLNPCFEHLPVENMVYENQEEYYEAINKSTENADCGVFIDFMLQEILFALKKHRGDPINHQNDPINDLLNDPINLLVDLIKKSPEKTYSEYAMQLGKSEATVKRLIGELKKQGKIERMGAKKNGWWKVNE